MKTIAIGTLFVLACFASNQTKDDSNCEDWCQGRCCMGKCVDISMKCCGTTVCNSNWSCCGSGCLWWCCKPETKCGSAPLGYCIY